MRETTTIRDGLSVPRDSSDRGTNRLPSSTALEAEVLEFTLEDGTKAVAEFVGGALRWRATSPDEQTVSIQGPCNAVEIRPGAFHVDADISAVHQALSLVVDRDAGRAIVVDSVVRLAGGLVTLHQRIRTARLEGARTPYEPIGETRELIGRRLICEYAPGTAMEHLYLNSSTIAWQRLKSPPELAFEVEWERASMWKVRDELFLLGSVGRFPLELVLLLDLEQNRNVGHLFGRSSSGSLLYQLCGARIIPLGRTDYPPGYLPA